jgi:hypothetical protein
MRLTPPSLHLPPKPHSPETTSGSSSEKLTANNCAGEAAPDGWADGRAAGRDHGALEEHGGRQLSVGECCKAVAGGVVLFDDREAERASGIST